MGYQPSCRHIARKTAFPQKALATYTVDDKRTVTNVINGKPAYVKSAKAIAELLGAKDLLSVLHPDLRAELGPPSGWGTPHDFFTTVGE